MRGRVTLVPLMAAALARAFPDEVAKDPSLALLPEGRRAALVADLAKLPKPEVATARRAWTSQAAFLKQFVRAGGKVAAGTGFELRGYPVPRIGLHSELAALVRAGLTPADALRAATVTAAELVGAKPGMTASRPARKPTSSSSRRSAEADRRPRQHHDRRPRGGGAGSQGPARPAQRARQ